MEIVITLKDLQYSWDKRTDTIINIPAFEVFKGERILIQGASGSGKTTLLNILSGVMLPDKGEVQILGKTINTMSGYRRDRFRADHLGVVFQQFNLLNYLTVYQNVTLPLRFSKQRQRKASEGNSQAETLLDALDIDRTFFDQSVDNLSVGQQQRVALARAMVGAPEIIIADEPTSALDRPNRERFLELLALECDRLGSTLIMVSHDESLGSYFNRIVTFDSMKGLSHA